MKWTILLLTIVILFAVAQYMIAKNADTTEQQKYTVLHAEDSFEIRYYPRALVASVESNAVEMRDNANGNFRRIAGYIFGNNERNQKIAMTAPVRMEKTSAGNKMSFIMPAEYSMDELPKPNDAGVVLSDLAEDTVAVLRFTGFVSDKEIEQKKAELEQWLSKKNIMCLSGYRYMGYNPPYQLTHRRNEVAVSVRWSGE
jgi:hypothetical protein